MGLRRDSLVRPRMPRPGELLLGVQQAREIDGGFGITEELGRRRSQGIDRRESWRNAGRGIRADGSGESSNSGGSI